MGRLLRKKEVLALAGISSSTLWRMIRANRFPPPVRVTDNIPAWPEDQVIAWREGLETVTAKTSKPVAPGAQKGRKPKSGFNTTGKNRNSNTKEN